jgi:hypothetical protein
MVDSITLSLALTLHTGINFEYNQIHPHVRYSTNTFISGIYYNSVRKPSVYVGKTFSLGSTTLETILVTGYMYPVIPAIKLNYGNFFVSPLVDKVKGKTQTGIVLGTEFKF